MEPLKIEMGTRGSCDKGNMGHVDCHLLTSLDHTLSWYTPTVGSTFTALAHGITLVCLRVVHCYPLQPQGTVNLWFCTSSLFTKWCYFHHRKSTFCLSLEHFSGNKQIIVVPNVVAQFNVLWWVLQSQLLLSLLCSRYRAVCRDAPFVHILGSTCCLCTPWIPTVQFLQSLQQGDQGGRCYWECCGNVVSPTHKGGEEQLQNDEGGWARHFQLRLMTPHNTLSGLTFETCLSTFCPSSYVCGVFPPLDHVVLESRREGGK